MCSNKDLFKPIKQDFEEKDFETIPLTDIMFSQQEINITSGNKPLGQYIKNL